jgi:hypothetical protein
LTDKNSLGHQVAEDTARARRGVGPDILVSTYGTKPPKAAVFNQGISDRAGAQEAQDAQRRVKPSQYYRNRR